jgi:MFS family permease
MSAAPIELFPRIAPPAHAQRHGIGFWLTASTFAIAMAFSTVPTPLYVLYQRRDGFSTTMITVIFAAYALGVTASLFLAGHISDWLGRRRTLLAALLLSLVAAVSFLLWRSTAGLIVARAVNGLSIGVITATATAYLAELHAHHRPDASSRRSEIVATAANLGGLGVGALVAGILAQWVAGPLTVPYLVFGGLLVLAMGGLLLVPETKLPPVELPRYRPQRVSVPAAARGRYFGAAAGGLLAFAAFGLFTALAPTFLAQTLGHTSRALGGAAAFTVFATAALLQSLLGSRSARTLLLAGAVVLPLGLVLVTAAVWLPHPSLALFLVGGAITGAGAGLLVKAGLSTVVEIAPPEGRAEALAGFFLAAYVGLSVPVIALGVVATVLPARTALLGFTALTLVGALATAAPAARTADVLPVEPRLFIVPRGAGKVAASETVTLELDRSVSK